MPRLRVRPGRTGPQSPALRDQALRLAGRHKKAPLAGCSDWPWGSLEDLGFGVAHGGELGLAQPFGFEDLLANQG